MPAPQRLLEELIALPSVNPRFLPEGDLRAGEARVVQFLAHTARRAGLDTTLCPVSPGRPNLLVRLVPSGTVRQRVLLAPHSDTVGEPGLADRMFEPKRSGGRIYGRGACDTKGSVAAMLAAVLAVAHGRKRPAHSEIVLAVLVDEEFGQSGSRALVRSGLRANLAIVGEPTGLRVVTAHKGVAWFTLQTRGRSAHGARPELGVNAIHRMARVVDLLETRYANWLCRRRHPLLGPPSINVGWIQGGQQANIVPDHCQIKVDRRMLPGESGRGVELEVRAWLRKHALSARIEGSSGELPCLAMETDPKLPLVQRLFGLAGQRKLVGVDYFSDASVLAHGGIPAVLFGPGDIAQAHTTDEWIAVASLARATHLFTTFLRSLP